MGLLGDVLEGATDLLSEQGAEAAASTGSELTRVIASFHSDDGFDGLVDAEFGSGKPMRIVGFGYTKTFGGAGQWSLTVKPANDFDVLELWPDPEDVWVRIFVVKNGKPYDVVFGLIDTITESVSRSQDGSRSVTYQIQGSDFQKALETTQLYVNIWEGLGAIPMVPLFDAMSERLQGSPDVIVRGILEAWLGNNGVADKQWALPSSLGGGYLFDKLELRFGRELKGHIYDPTLLQADTWQGRSLWDALQEYSNGLMNEMFTALRKDGIPGSSAVFPQLILRERPFPTEATERRVYDKLKTWELHPIDIQSRNLSRGAPESRFNYWLIDGLGWMADGNATQYMMQEIAQRSLGVPGSVPVYSVDDVRKHGFRFWRQGSRYLPWRENETWLEHGAKWLHMIHDWYAVSPFERTGTLGTTNIKPMVHIGNRVREIRKDKPYNVVYYVEGVTHQWQYPGSGTTQLHVTRGERSDEDLLEIVYRKVFGLTPGSILDTALGLVGEVNEALGNPVPTGSPMTLDKTVGQIPNPERLYLEKRGRSPSEVRTVRGEAGRKEQLPARLDAGDLPDRSVPDDLRARTGEVLPANSRRRGSLSQRELERGVRLPVRGKRDVVEPTTTSNAEFQEKRARRNLRTGRA